MPSTTKHERLDMTVGMNSGRQWPEPTLKIQSTQRQRDTPDDLAREKNIVAAYGSFDDSDHSSQSSLEMGRVKKTVIDNPSYVANHILEEKLSIRGNDLDIKQGFPSYSSSTVEENNLHLLPKKGSILGKISAPIFQELWSCLGVRDDLQKLKSTVTSVQAVLLDAQEQQATNNQLGDWLGKLNDSLHKAEIVLEKFEIDALRRKIFDQSFVSKVRSIFSSSNQLAFRFKMAHKIKNVREEFDEIALDRNKFNLTVRYEESVVIHREMTHSFVQEGDVIGRDNDIQDVVTFLLDTCDGENVSVLPIFGIGGLGKTTIAKRVYNDKRIVGNFSLRIWACISDDFDLEKNIVKILKPLGVNNCSDKTLDGLQNELRKKLRNTKYLLILDDVWNEDPMKWDDLKSLLMGGACGSKIIVTTRSKKVADIVSPTGPRKKIQGLSPEESLELFLKLSFGSNQDANKIQEFVEFAKKIVEKCKGVPLAIKTLGKLLYMQTDEREWIKVRDNDIWKIPQKEGDILPALKLSYYHLSINLRLCFSFCALFPKDYELTNFELINIWCANGLLRQLECNEDMEDLGLKYINQLLSIGFFQEASQYGTILNFRMHDLVHDLALQVAKPDIINMGCEQVQPDFSTRKLRHLSFPNMETNEFPSWLLQQKDVRTICFRKGIKGPIVESRISKFKHLHFLDVRGFDFGVLPDSIGSLIHLKCLNISGNDLIRSLPKSICKLVGLEILDFSSCPRIEKLPKGFGKLIRLRQLSISTRERCLPEREFQSLTTLQRLFIQDCKNLEFLFSDDVMQRFSALRMFLIYACKSLVSLPIKGLRRLPRLEDLRIYKCKNLEMNEALVAGEEGKIRHTFRYLMLSELPKLVGDMPKWLLHGANLKHIQIGYCPNLTNIMPERTVENLKFLQKLEIFYCEKLTSLPEGMQSLTHLNEIRIIYCPELTRRCQRETGEDWHKISHVPNIYFGHIKI